MSLRNTSSSGTQAPRFTAMVVDDTSLFRRIMVAALENITGVQVLHTAENGADCLQTLKTSAPVDVVFLDVEMPVKNGMDTLREIRHLFPHQTVVMVSGHNQGNMAITIAALEAGAYDFIAKPQADTQEQSQKLLKDQLIGIIRSLLWRRSQDRLQTRKSRAVASGMVSDEGLPTAPLAPVAEKEEWQLPSIEESVQFLNETLSRTQSSRDARLAKLAPPPVSAKAAAQPAKGGMVLRAAKEKANVSTVQPEEEAAPGKTRPVLASGRKPLINVRAVLIGISTGGPAALMQFIPQLPASLNVPIFIVQHMPPKFTESLANSLNDASQVTVVEAKDGEVPKPNVVYIAPGGQHMEVRTGDKRGEVVIKLTNDPPVNSCRPAVDTLFKSAASIYPNQNISIIMTGMGRDGTEGVRALKAPSSGTYTITQSQNSCVVYGMPKATDDENLSDESVDLSQMARRLAALLKKS